MTLVPVAEPQTIETRMADGVALVADVYRPVGAGPAPVLMMRQPYGRKIASTVTLAHPAWFAAHGYVVMVQDVRGRGDSGGRFRLLADDIADGAATLDFAAGLDGGTGQVATYGFSYQGMNQYLALAGSLKSGSKRPDAMVVVMAGWDLRADWVTEGGAIRLAGAQFWALQMAAENARIAGDTGAYHALRSALGGLCSGPVPARMAVLETYAHYTHYHDWLADDPAYWQSISPHALLAGQPLDVPSLHIGGWMDIMLTGTIAAHKAFRAGPARQELAIGPWAHLPWGRRVGALDCGPEAGAGLDPDIVRFLDHVLKGAEPAKPAVRLFDLGTKRYLGFDALPDGEERSLFLASGGRAAPSTEDGTLGDEPGSEASDRLVHDPWRPAPSVGLHLGTPGGYVDRAGIDDRADVAVYTSEPLGTALSLMGAVRAEIFVACDRPSFDLNATLSIVSQDGTALAVTGGHRRVMAVTDSAIPIDMRLTGYTVPQGARLRLSLAAASWPAFMVNPGTGAKPEDCGLADCRVTTLVIRHGGAHPSRLAVTVVA